jgi:tetratricopeptide (TPR) repeat protein
VLRALAGFAAMEGRFDDARAAIADCRAILQDLGLRVTEAHVAETVGIVELLAGDAEAAERELRAGYDSVVEMGDAVVTAVLAALLAQALYAQGRDAEALAFSDVSAEAAAPDDISAHVQWRAARAKALARTGRPGEADAVARDAVARAARTDFLVVHGDALLDLAEVLRLGGREQDAVAAASDALVLYRRKGNVVAAERARAFAAASPAVTDRSGS